MTSSTPSGGPSGLSNPTGVAFSRAGGDLLVADFSNNRALVFLDVSHQQEPSFVYGQNGSFVSTSFVPPTSASNLLQPRAAVFNGLGGALVVDSGNHRCVYYDSGRDPASFVFGQADFNGAGANRGNLSFPSPGSLFGPSHAVFDTANNLYIVDQNNNRVLFFSAADYLSGMQVATRVYGQIDLQSNTPGLGASGLTQPYGVAVRDDFTVFISDAGNNRILRFPPGSTIANGVIGQTNFVNSGSGTTASTFATPAGFIALKNGGLVVADANNNRVLYFSPGFPDFNAAASVVFGQNGDFSSRDNPVPSAGSLNNPQDVAYDYSSNLLAVADTSNNRVVLFTLFTAETITSGESVTIQESLLLDVPLTVAGSLTVVGNLTLLAPLTVQSGAFVNVTGDLLLLGNLQMESGAVIHVAGSLNIRPNSTLSLKITTNPGPVASLTVTVSQYASVEGVFVQDVTILSSFSNSDCVELSNPEPNYGSAFLTVSMEVQQKCNGLSAGGIVGIAIGCVAAAVLFVLLTWRIIIWRRQVYDQRANAQIRANMITSK